MGKNTLGIAWLHGRFEAVNLAASSNSAGWLSPISVNTPQEFAVALAQAVRETGFRGQKVMVVIDHRNLLFHVQDVPPAKGRVLTKLLDRLVAQNQFFDEPAAHAHLELPQGKSLHRHLLSLLPQSLVGALAQACTDQGLRLDGLWPAAAVLSARLQKLPAPPAEIIILATGFGDSMNLLLGRSDGKLLFSRTVALGAAGQVERAAQEINRTLHYAQQQFGALVNLLFISSGGTFTALKTTPIRAGLKILDAPVGDSPTTLLQLAANLSSRAPLNFARDTGSRAVNRRGLAAAGIAAAFIAAISTTVRIETQIHAREHTARIAEARLKSEAEVLSTNNALQHEATRLRTILAMVGSTNDPPVVELLARSLPSIIPPSLRLTELQIEEAFVGWKFTIKGAAREDAVDLTARLEKLEHELEQGVFQIKITDSSHRQMFRGELDTVGPNHGGALKRAIETPFFVTGVFQ